MTTHDEAQTAPVLSDTRIEELAEKTLSEFRAWADQFFTTAPGQLLCNCVSAKNPDEVQTRQILLLRNLFDGYKKLRFLLSCLLIVV